MFFKLYTLHIHKYTVYSELWCVSLCALYIIHVTAFKFIYMGHSQNMSQFKRLLFWKGNS